jgi:hypothetical protein
MNGGLLIDGGGVALRKTAQFRGRVPRQSGRALHGYSFRRKLREFLMPGTPQALKKFGESEQN